MHTRVMRSIVVLCACSAASSAMAQDWVHVEVIRQDGGCAPCCSGTELSIDLDPAEDHTFALSSCARRVNITTSSSTVDIGRFTFTGGPGAFPLDIVLGTGALNQSDSPTTAVGDDWEGFDATDIDDARFAGRIGGSLTGSILVPEMFRFDVDGAVQAPIHAGYSGNGGGFVVEAGAITSSGWIMVDSGNLKRVRTDAGGIYASITASAGSISEGVFASTDIGTTTSPISITAANFIDTVQGDNIYADIEVASGDVALIDASDGIFEGSVDAVNISRQYHNDYGTEGFFVYGDVDIQLTLSNSIRDHFVVTGGDFASSSQIHVKHLADAAELKIKKDGSGVGGSLLGDMYFSGVLGAQSLIEIDRSLAGTLSFDGDGTNSLKDDISILGDLGAGEGLTGQVILNADATADEAWGPGLVKFGADNDPSQFSLLPVPYYDNKSSTVGGGAVGLVPYYCHYKDCAPVGTKVNEAADGLDGLGACQQGFHALRKGSMGNPVDGPTIRHYGPIGQAGTGKPFTVKEKAITDTTCNWTDVTSGFTHTLHPGGDERAIKISGPFMPGYDYLIEPKVDSGGSDYLYCAGLTTTTVGLHDDDFRLRVYVLQDLTLSGDLAADDIDAWIDDPVDTTLDGIVDNADLVDVIEAVADSGGG
ncbi:MAG: hypothetical protein IPJ41_01740 [Phycisphaerales bacterium]|nr:hypothetical protein [Phycisphaerales bacterium]